MSRHIVGRVLVCWPQQLVHCSARTLLSMSAEEAQCQSIFSYYQYGRFDDLGSTEWSLEPSSGSSFQMIDVLQENVDSPTQTYIYQHQPNDDYLLDSIGAGFDSPSSLNGYWPGLDDSQLRQECEPASTPSTAPQVSRRPNQKGPYPCIICFEQYKTLEALEQHAKSEAHRVYRCPVLDCPKTFYRRDSYARHKSQHTASETQVCSWCFKSFKRKDHLDQHVRKLHTAEYARHSSRTVQHGRTTSLQLHVA